MKHHRFIGNFDFSKDRFGIGDKEFVNQIRNVLRLKAGEQIILGDDDMNEAICEIRDLRKDSIEVNVLETRKNKNEPKVRVALYCSILKRENFERVAQKATEVGVAEIVPLIAARTVKLNLRKDRLEKIIKEAAEQSGRGIVSVLKPAIDFDGAVVDSKRNGGNLFFDPSGEIEFKNLKLEIRNLHRIGVWVGPEGGWSKEELIEAKAAGFQIAGLGPLTLRAETAAIVASYFAVHVISW